MTRKKQITTSRDSFIFYRSFYESIKELPKEQQADVLEAVFELSLNNNEVELSGIPKAIFTLIKPQILANYKRYKNGSKPKAKDKQKGSKDEANKNVNVNDNVNKNDNNKDKKTKKEIWLDSLEDDKYKKPISYWLDYRNKLTNDKQWDYQYKAIKKFTNPNDVVEFSIGQGYQGLYEPKNKTEFTKDPQEMSDAEFNKWVRENG